tara:strand:- start:68 stop:865 length:798 start_codon:yes stop_codon:yes gene_type:complete
MAEKPKRVSEMTKEEREAFKKNIRKPKNIVNQSGVTTTIGPDFKKDGTIDRTYKQKREDMSKTPGILPKKRVVKTPKVVKKTTLKADPVKDKPKKLSTRENPLKDKPRSISAAKAAGEKYFYDKKGVKKLAVTGAELKKKGMTLKQWANTFAKRKQTKKDAEILKPYAKDKKLKKNPANKRAGGMMKKKGYAGGGKLKMVEKNGQKVPFYAADGKGKMRGGGMMMKKKGYAKGGAMKKKSYKKGGKVLKMRGGGLATRGTNFKIR